MLLYFSDQLTQPYSEKQKYRHNTSRGQQECCSLRKFIVHTGAFLVDEPAVKLSFYSFKTKSKLDTKLFSRRFIRL